MTYKIQWTGGDRPDLEALLRVDLDRALSGNPVKNLISHTVLLSGDFDGPSIDCHWDEGGEVVVAEYSEKAEWVSFSSEEIEKAEAQK